MTTTVAAPTKKTSPTAGANNLSRLIQKRTFDIVRYIILVIVAAVVLVPIVFTVLGGFKTNGQLVSDPVSLPSPWVFSNYVDVGFGANALVFWRELVNSMIIAAVAVSLTVTLASLAAFTFARMVFPGR